MKKIIVCGKENLNGKLIPAPVDEKNLTSDWIEEFLFDYNVARNPQYEEEIMGYFEMGDTVFEARVEYTRNSNYVRYTFFRHNWIDVDDINCFEKMVKEFFSENELTIELVCTSKDDGTFDACICLFFYAREDE